MFQESQPIPGRTVGYLGPQGTYSEEIVLSLYRADQAQPVPFASIDAAIRAVEAGEIDECIVPVENSLEGSINITLDTLAHEVNLFITKEMVLSIRNNLLVKAGSAIIKTIVSHPQPLAQCRKTLTRLFPKAEIKPVESTAEAARLVAAGAEGYAAVGSLNAGAIYGLQVLAADIQDNAANCTRFISLERQPTALVQEKCKTSIVCQLNGERPGALYNMLEEFARREVNLTRIESRPARTGLGMYIFFLDIAGSEKNTAVQAAIEAVQKKSIWFKSFGTYPVDIMSDCLYPHS